MTRATGLGPLPELLEERAGWRALRKSFAAERVPLAVIDDKNVLVPLESMMWLFERAALAVGERTFGLCVGRAMSNADFGIWQEYSLTASTLERALRRAERTVHFQQPGARMPLETEGEFAVWRYCPPLARTSTQHTDHLVFPMMRFIERFLGAGWQPSWIEVNYRRDREAGALLEALAAPVRFEQPCVGIAFERSRLNSMNPNTTRTRHVTFADVAASYAAPSEREPLQSMLAIVTLRLLDGRADIEGAAEAAGIGVQTLQRLLRQDGVSYRQLLDIARSGRAQALLRETDRSVTDIALDLGYADHANFTRAFNRWLGCSPSDFRGRVTDGRGRDSSLPAVQGP